MAFTTNRIAAFQRQPAFDDIAGATLRLLDDMRWCETQGVHLAIFPECFLQGYATDRQTIARRALNINSPQFRTFAAKFSRLSLDMVVGFIERRANDFYNSAADKISHGCTCIVNPDGVVVARVAEGAEGAVVYDIGADPAYRAA